MKTSTRKPRAAAAKAPAQAKVETTLVLRVCTADLTSHGGFQWPSTIGAKVEAPDWLEKPSCGNGLHGWLHGAGEHDCSEHVGNPDAKWLVVEVVSSQIVMLGGKCKFPSCIVRHIGDKNSATQYLIANEPHAKNVAVIGATLTVGKEQTCMVGALGTATAGDSGTATAGDSGTATAGYSGTATAGYSGTATAGYRGTATAGYSGTATAGDSGTATAGDSGTATAGELGELRLRYADHANNRWRTVIAYVGENGIKANTRYRLDDNHKFVEVK